MSRHTFETRVFWSPSALRKRAPKPSPNTARSPHSTLEKAWAAVRDDFSRIAPLMVRGASRGGAPEAYREAVSSLKKKKSIPKTLCADQQASIAISFGVSDYWGAPIRPKAMDSLLCFWHLHSGVEFALDAMRQTLLWRRERRGGHDLESAITAHRATNPTSEAREPRDELARAPGGWKSARRWLSTLSEEEFAAARTHASQICQRESLLCRACFAYAFGEPAWIVESLSTLADLSWRCPVGALIAMTSGPEFAEAYCKTILSRDHIAAFQPPLSHRNLVDVVDAFEHEAPRVLCALQKRHKIEDHNARCTQSEAVYSAIAEAIAMVESEEAASALIDRLDNVASHQATEDFASRAPQWLLKVLLERPELDAREEILLKKILSRHLNQTETWSRALSREARDRLEKTLHTLKTDPVYLREHLPLASEHDVPSWLLHPPKAWKARKAPGFWSLSSLPPIMCVTGSRLSDLHMENLRKLLLNTREDQPAPREALELQNACTAESLDAFCLALVDAWLDSGGEARGRWTLTGSLPLLSPPKPAVKAIMDETFFLNKSWYPQKRLSMYTGPQLDALLKERGARLCKDALGDVDFMVTDGLTPSFRARKYSWARKAGGELIGESDLLRLLLGRPITLPARDPHEKNKKKNDALAQLRGALHEEEGMKILWKKVLDAFEDMPDDLIRLAVDYTNTHINALSDEEQQWCEPIEWIGAMMAGEDSPAYEILRALTLHGCSAKTGANLLRCTSLKNLRWFSVTTRVPRAFWPEFAAAEHLSSLESLTLHNVSLHPQSATVLAESPVARNLKELSLQRVNAKNRALYRLLTTGHWENLEVLKNLSTREEDQMRDVLEALRDAESLSLKALGLIFWEMPDRSLWAECLASLRVSRLGALRVKSRTRGPLMEALAEANNLSGLRKLDLEGPVSEYPDDPGLSRILKADHFLELEELNVFLSCEAHLEAFLGMGKRPSLKSLRVGFCLHDHAQDVDLTRLDFPGLQHLTWRSGRRSSQVVDLLLSNALPNLRSVHLSGISDEAINTLIAHIDRPKLTSITTEFGSDLRLLKKLNEKLGNQG